MGWIRFVEGEKKVYCITNVNAVSFYYSVLEAQNICFKYALIYLAFTFSKCRLSPFQLASKQSKVVQQIENPLHNLCHSQLFFSISVCP
jgi:hypothetical protein